MGAHFASLVFWHQSGLCPFLFSHQYCNSGSDSTIDIDDFLCDQDYVYFNNENGKVTMTMTISWHDDDDALRFWATKYSISHKAFSELLTISVNYQNILELL